MLSLTIIVKNMSQLIYTAILMNKISFSLAPLFQADNVFQVVVSLTIQKFLFFGYKPHCNGYNCITIKLIQK